MEQQVFEVRVRVERFLDAVQELGPDDAAAAPEQGDVAVVERPVVLLGGRLKLHEALGVAADFGGVEGLPHRFDERLFVADGGAGGLGGRAREDFAGPDAGVLQRRHAAGIDGFGHHRARHAEIEGELAHPFAGPFGPGDVEDFVDQEAVAALVVLDAEDVAADFDEVALQLAAVPFVEDVVQLVVGQADRLP